MQNSKQDSNAAEASVSESSHQKKELSNILDGKSQDATSNMEKQSHNVQKPNASSPAVASLSTDVPNANPSKEPAESSELSGQHSGGDGEEAITKSSSSTEFSKQNVDSSSSAAEQQKTADTTQSHSNQAQLTEKSDALNSELKASAADVSSSTQNESTQEKKSAPSAAPDAKNDSTATSSKSSDVMKKPAKPPSASTEKGHSSVTPAPSNSPTTTQKSTSDSEKKDSTTNASSKPSSSSVQNNPTQTSKSEDGKSKNKSTASEAKSDGKTAISISSDESEADSKSATTKRRRITRSVPKKKGMIKELRKKFLEAEYKLDIEAQDGKRCHFPCPLRIRSDTYILSFGEVYPLQQPENMSRSAYHEYRKRFVRTKKNGPVHPYPLGFTVQTQIIKSHIIILRVEKDSSGPLFALYDDNGGHFTGTAVTTPITKWLRSIEYDKPYTRSGSEAFGFDIDTVQSMLNSLPEANVLMTSALSSASKGRKRKRTAITEKKVKKEADSASSKEKKRKRKKVDPSDENKPKKKAKKKVSKKKESEKPPNPPKRKRKRVALDKDPHAHSAVISSIQRARKQEASSSAKSPPKKKPKTQEDSSSAKKKKKSTSSSSSDIQFVSCNPTQTQNKFQFKEMLTPETWNKKSAAKKKSSSAKSTPDNDGSKPEASSKQSSAPSSKKQPEIITLE